jgi:hypothetical protein
VLAFFEELATRERLVEEAHSSLAVLAMNVAIQFVLKIQFGQQKFRSVY